MFSLPSEVIWLIGQRLSSVDFDNFGSTNRQLRKILIENVHRWRFEFGVRYPDKTESQIFDLFRGDNQRLSHLIKLPTPLFNRLASPFNPYWMAIRMIERYVPIDRFSDLGHAVQFTRDAKIRTFLGHAQPFHEEMDMSMAIELDSSVDYHFDGYLSDPLAHLMGNLTHGASPDFVEKIINRYGGNTKEFSINYCRMVLTDNFESPLIAMLTDKQERYIVDADAVKIYQTRYQPTQSDAIYYQTTRTLDQCPRIANYLYHLARTPIESLEQLLILLDEDPDSERYRKFIESTIDPSLISQFLSHVTISNYSDGDYPKAWVDFVVQMIFKNYEILWTDFFDLLGRVVDQFIDCWQHPLIGLVRQVLFDHEDLGYVQEQLIEYFGDDFEPTNYFGILVYMAINNHSFKNRHVFPTFDLATHQISLYGIELNQPWTEIFLILPPGTTLGGQSIGFVRMTNRNKSTKMTMELPIVVSNPQVAIPAVICQ